MEVFKTGSDELYFVNRRSCDGCSGLGFRPNGTKCRKCRGHGQIVTRVFPGVTAVLNAVNSAICPDRKTSEKAIERLAIDRKLKELAELHEGKCESEEELRQRAGFPSHFYTPSSKEVQRDLDRIQKRIRKIKTALKPFTEWLYRQSVMCPDLLVSPFACDGCLARPGRTLSLSKHEELRAILRDCLDELVSQSLRMKDEPHSERSRGAMIDQLLRKQAFVDLQRIRSDHEAESRRGSAPDPVAYIDTFLAEISHLDLRYWRKCEHCGTYFYADDLRARCCQPKRTDEGRRRGSLCQERFANTRPGHREASKAYYHEKKDFHEAAEDGDLEGVKAWVERGRPVDVKLKGLTALQQADHYEHEEIKDYLREHGAKPDPGTW